ncbi:multidrug efflux transporter AcrB transmembrane domain-containing protein [Rhizophagus irregularis]|uniref:Multidrug efflux transporter AcrB transmembrane domain-containing protein n=1 Tax=Rhizophagus irregularis TaxID=588596 RepID=A0A2N0SIA5_9GLOM|nr:multidrug efflux transporter AcrB transmembrane domain-containing protein [Rhizophagus irregularis]
MKKLYSITLMFVIWCSFTISTSFADYIHQEGYCVMHGHCGSKSFFGKELNCPHNKPAIEPDYDLRSKLVQICGSQYENSLTCCDANQLDDLNSSTKQVETLISTCPACWKNFLNFFCTLACSPNQSTFLNITSIGTSPITNLKIVTSVDFFVGETLGKGFYDSCKDIKFAATNGYVMDFIGGGAKNYHDMLAFLGQERPIGSPFQIDFPLNDTSDIMLPYDDPPKRCNDIDVKYRCSCVDCQSVCPVLEPTPEEKPPCLVGSLTCWAFGLYLTYFILLMAIVIRLFVEKFWNRNRFDREGFEPVALTEEEDTSLTQEHPSRRYALNLLLQDYFYQQGYMCAKYPWQTIGVAALIVFLATLGCSQFEVERDPVRLWVAPNSDSAMQKEFFDQNFGPFYRTQQIFISNINSGLSIINYNTIKKLFIIEREIRELKSFPDNHTLQDLCFRPNGDSCIVQSVTGYWQSDLDRFSKETWEEEFKSCTFAPTYCLPDFQQPLKPDMILGGFENEDYINAKALVLTYVLRNSLNQNEIDAAREWEKSLREYLDKLIGGENDKIDVSQLRITFSTESSLEAELNKSTNTDIYTIILSYLVMFFYASLALGNATLFPRTIIDSKFMLGISGIIIVLASVSTAVGIFSLLGIKVTLIIAEVIPFLVLAVGVDNIFILNHEFERLTLKSFGEVSVEERIAKTLGRMGPSILLSALSETIAFGLGGIVTMPAVRNFALYASLAVWVDFSLQVTAFVAFLSLDAKRQEEDRIDCFPCYRIERAPERIDKEGLLQKCMRKYYAPFVLNKKVRIVIVICFVGVFMTSLSFVPQVELGLDQRIALPFDSYLVDYFNDLDAYFRIGPPVYFVTKDFNVTKVDGQKSLCGRFSTCNQLSLANILEQERKRSNVSYIAEPTSVWIDDFFHWLNPSLEMCCRFKKGTDQKELCDEYDDDNDCEICFKDREPQWNITMSGMPQGEEFLKYLGLWLKSSPDESCPLAGKAAYGDAIVRDLEDITVKTSHFRTFHTPLKSQNDYIAAYHSAHRISELINEENPSIQVFPYSVFYIFFEQYEYIISLAAEIFFLAFVSIWFVTTLLLGSAWTGFIVVCHVIMIITNVLGIMALWGVSLNAISLVNLVICVGIGVEFCVHIARAFIVGGEGVDREERAYRSIVDVGSSVLSGITLTKFWGILVLAFTRSKIFEVYYFRMYVSMVISGAFHGLLLLPIILSLIGGEGVGSGEDFDYDVFEDEEMFGGRPIRSADNRMLVDDGGIESGESDAEEL